MQKLNHLSTKSKLIMMLLLVSLGAMMAIAYLGWRASRQEAIQSAQDQLSTIRASKAAQVESYFKNLWSQIDVLAEEEGVGSAMVHLNKEFKRLERQSVEDEWYTEIEAFYAEEFLPVLEKDSPEPLYVEDYLFDLNAANYLQYHYVVNNRHAPDERYLLDNARDGSDYSRWHERYHPFFRDVVERFGYEDIYLIDYDTGDIVYSVKKKVDLGTNLYDGPFERSSLGFMFAAGNIEIIDFTPYPPSYNEPMIFLTAYIYNGPHAVGQLVIQISADEINRIMSSDQQWAEDGLGETGEAYIVGFDVWDATEFNMTMRSEARPFLEDKESYLESLRSTNLDPARIDSIDYFDKSMLFQEVKTQPVTEAFRNQIGLQESTNYQDIQVLSAYTPLNIHNDITWVLLVEMALEEVMQPVDTILNQFLIATGILMVLISILAILLSYYFTWPVAFLIAQTEKINAGQFDETVELHTGDEYARLSHTINELVGNLHAQNVALTSAQQRNEGLLLNILPQSVAERVQRGETQIVDQVQQTTILYAEVTGLEALFEQRNAGEVAQQLDELFRMFDAAADRLGVEQRPLIGTSFLATCGLTKPRLDHINRIIDFATVICNLLRQSNQINRTALNLKIGIHTGDVTAGVIGNKRFLYDLWGEAVNIASQIQRAAKPGAILVSEAIYERVSEFYELVKDETILLSNGIEMSAWALHNAESSLDAPVNPNAKALSSTVDASSTLLSEERLSSETAI